MAVFVRLNLLPYRGGLGFNLERVPDNLLTSSHVYLDPNIIQINPARIERDANYEQRMIGTYSIYLERDFDKLVRCR